MKLSVAWKWFDLWVGAYWDAGHRTLYVCPLPTVVFRLEFRGPKDESKHRADRSRPVIPTTGILDHTPELDKAEYEALIRECDRLMGEGTKAALERDEAQAENARLRGALGTAIELLDRYSAAVHCLSIDREPEVEEQVARLRAEWRGDKAIDKARSGPTPPKEHQGFA